MRKRNQDSSAIAVLEDTTNLLRRTPLATLLCHWLGSAPFALAVLLFWNDLTQFRAADSTCVVESLLLAVLLVWMSCWRAVFAGRVRRQLSGAPDSPWMLRRIGKLAASQSFLGATKLIAVPFAALVIFPLGGAIAFYRYAAALADREDLDAAGIISKAAKLATRDTRLNWAVLPLLMLLQVVVAANLALTLAILPQMVRILTGFESVFSRGGMYVVQNPLFVLLVVEASWLLFDPFLQAAYCVLCFRAESMETGEDLRAALRRVRQTAPALAAVLVLAALPLHAREIPRDQLERAVQKTMQAHEYDWRLPPDARNATSQPPWLVSAANHVIDGFKAAARAVGNAIESLLQWIFGKLPEPGQQNGSAPAVALHWSVYVLIAAIAGLAIWFAWMRRKQGRARRKPAVADAAVAIRLDAEDLTPDRLPEDRWLEMAEECLRDNNFRFALRALYLANLAWLGQRELIAIHPGKTNHEYELELRRKVRGMAETPALFAENVTAFERAWYGMYDVAAEDAREFRARSSRMKTALQEVTA
jgi:hypothetical protein